MKRIDKVKELVPDISSNFLIKKRCPSDYGLRDDYLPFTKCWNLLNCKKCWNREAGDAEATNAK